MDATYKIITLKWGQQSRDQIEEHNCTYWLTQEEKKPPSLYCDHMCVETWKSNGSIPYSSALRAAMKHQTKALVRKIWFAQCIDCKPLTSDLSRNDRQCAKVLQFQSSGAIGSWSHQTLHSIVFKRKKQNLQTNFARWGTKKTRLTAPYYGHFFMKGLLWPRDKTTIHFLVKRTSLIRSPVNTAKFFWPIGDHINRVPLYYV